MLKRVEIENFRGVNEGGVDGLAPISILVGPNNSGKSTVLEAIAALGLGTNAKAVAGLLIRRGGPPLDALARVICRGAKRATISATDGFDRVMSWSTTFTVDKDPLDSLIMHSEGLVEPVAQLKTSVSIHQKGGRLGSTYLDGQGKKYGSSGESLFPVSFVNVEAVRAYGTLEDAYTRIDETGQLGRVIDYLGRSMSDLTDLRILKVGADFVLHTFRKNRPPVPAYLAGDGFKRFLAIAAAVIGTPRGVVLLEEPESFQHPHHLQDLASLLHLAAREGTQIILTTYSSELIDLLVHEPNAERQPYPAVHRVRVFDGKLRATTIDREHAVMSLDELLEDLRN